MAGVVHGTAVWPGAISVESCTYTVSQGISPGVAILRILPQPVFPAMFGNLVITDGNETVTIPGCRIDSLKVEQDESGTVWALEIVDRRWRWRDLGAIFGCYNQLDPHGKLIPFTIRSPRELALLCLAAMGEPRFRLNLPPGINNPGPLVAQPIPENGGVNPPINWTGIPPAQALQQVAEQFGCRVVYQLATDSVLVTPLGVGADLPPGSVHRQGPSLKAPETPDAVGVIGSATRYQTRLALIAVGEEWDGSFRPIDTLSYAPLLEGKVHIWQVTVAYDGQSLGSPLLYQIWVGSTGNEPALGGGFLAEHSVTAGDTQAVIAADLAAQINASTDPKVKGKMTAAAAGNVVTITGTQQGYSFGCLGRVSGSPTPPATQFPSHLACTQLLKQEAGLGQKGWEDCEPRANGGFGNVRATDRLTYEQALALAEKSVFRCYQVSNVDASGAGAIQVPGYGPLVRRQQIMLQDTQVDQIEPAAGDDRLQIDTNDPNIPAGLQNFMANFYNGYSRDKAAVVYGSYYPADDRIIFVNRGNQDNTPEVDPVVVPFSVDPIWQVITFSDYVYKLDGGKVKQPRLTLQTAINVRNATTNQIECYVEVRPLLGQKTFTNPKYAHHPDVQLNVSSRYTDDHRIAAAVPLEADPFLRADYYLKGLAAQYQLSGAQIIEYNGVKFVNLDGAIQQVTWNVGGDGAYTVASKNTEHDVWVPTYPARRRAEFLPPAAGGVAQRANMTGSNINYGSGGRGEAGLGP